jgi:hypothetical protein
MATARDTRDTDSNRRTVTTNINEDAQRRRYGGFNFGAAFFGWLVATAVGVLLTSLFVAMGGAFTLTSDVNVENAAEELATIGVAGAILFLIVLAIAYYAGGYVAGRMSRFDGARQGLGVWVMGILATIILAVAGGALGAKYNLLEQLNLPRIPIGEGDLTTGGLVTLLFAVVVTALAAIAGGIVGHRYHDKVDQVGYEARR